MIANVPNPLKPKIKLFIVSNDETERELLETSIKRQMGASSNSVEISTFSEYRDAMRDYIGALNAAYQEDDKESAALQKPFLIITGDESKEPGSQRRFLDVIESDNNFPSNAGKVVKIIRLNPTYTIEDEKISPPAYLNVISHIGYSVREDNHQEMTLETARQGAEFLNAWVQQLQPPYRL